MAVIRFGISLEKELLDALDSYAEENHLPNRSQAVRQLINTHTVMKKWQCNNKVAGSITLVYEHHKRDILNQLASIQHQHYNIILSTQHFHLDHDKCMEIIAVKGIAKELTELADKLIALKGVDHGKLTMSRAD